MINLSSICSKAFRALQRNTLKTKMGYSYLGENENLGATIVSVDAVSPSPLSWANHLGKSNGVQKTFSNAEKTETFYILKTVYDKTYGTVGGAWTVGDTVDVDISSSGFDLPSNATIQGFFTGNYPYALGGLNVPLMGTVYGSVLTIHVRPTPSGIGSLNLIIPITISYSSGANGLKKVPVNFLEARKIEPAGKFYPIAMRDRDIRVRYGDVSLPVITTDGTKFNTLQARGGDTKHIYDFGHQMVYHAVGDGVSANVYVKHLEGYNILGIADIKVDNSSITDPTVTLSDSTYTINLGPQTLGKDIALTLYTDSKYFLGNKQGRSIYDCFQMVNLGVVETPNGINKVFTLKTWDSSVVPQVLALASYSSTNGSGYAFVTPPAGTIAQKENLITNNKSFPDSSATTNYITFSDAPDMSSNIQVPALVRTAISSTEGYAFYYKYNAYQGIFGDSTNFITGAFEYEGPAITTTAGSGVIADSTFNQGLVEFSDTTVILGYGTNWLSLTDASTGALNARYVFTSTDSNDDSTYAIASIPNNTTLILASPTHGSGVGGQAYTITAIDQPDTMYHNIIDRFPTYSVDLDYLGRNSKISFNSSEGSVLENRIVSKVQDVIDFPPNTVQIGRTSTADSFDGRGRAGVYIQNSELGRGNLGLRYENIDQDGEYKKTYQSYIVNRDNSGRLYLMVVGSETELISEKCLLSEQSSNDSVDLFEIPGRPLIANRIQ